MLKRKTSKHETLYQDAKQAINVVSEDASVAREKTRESSQSLRDEVVKQHTKPCGECPFRRVAPKGWLGPHTVQEILEYAYTETVHLCHLKNDAQCAGMGIYRANVGKSPRYEEVLRLTTDKERVFSTPSEFIKHHSTPSEFIKHHQKAKP